MGLFGPKKSDRGRSQPAVRPIVIQPADLVAFASQLAQVEASVGVSDAAVRRSIRELSESVGGVDPWTVLQRGIALEEIRRPWRWCASACELANETGDYTLAPRVFVFMQWWRAMEHHMGAADYADMWMDPVTADAVETITLSAREAIENLPDSHRIAPAANEVILVGHIRADVEAAAGT